MRSEMPRSLRDRIRIVTVDEHVLFREGLCVLLSRQSGFEVVGEASTCLDALPLIKREQPDIVLVAISEERRSDIKSLPELLAASETTRVLALSDSADQEVIREAVRHGAAGVLTKDKSAATLVKAIECVHAGTGWLDRSTTVSLLRELSPRHRAARQDPEQVKIASLTEREREVIRLAGSGLKNRQIAEKLFISDTTVHHHLTSIYSKLEVGDRMELLIYSYRNGLAELPC